MSSEPFAKLACPMCGWHHPLLRTGVKALSKGNPARRRGELCRFGKSIPLQEFGVLRWMVSHGNCSDEEAAAGRKRGIETVDNVTVEELVGDPDFGWIADDIYAQARDLVERIEHARGERERKSE